MMVISHCLLAWQKEMAANKTAQRIPALLTDPYYTQKSCSPTFFLPLHLIRLWAPTLLMPNSYDCTQTKRRLKLLCESFRPNTFT